MSIEWLLALDIKIFLTIIIVVGVLFSVYVIHRLRKQDEMNKEFWKELKENDRHYHQTDKMQYGLTIAFQSKFPEVELINQSVDAIGDHALNRSV